VNDAPVATNFTINDLRAQVQVGENSEGNKIATIDLSTLVTDVDGDELIYSVDETQGDVEARVQNKLLLIQFAQGPDRGFEIRYTAQDPSKAVGTAFISYRPTCGWCDQNNS
jgi:hypothetical protein